MKEVCDEGKKWKAEVTHGKREYEELPQSSREMIEKMYGSIFDYSLDAVKDIVKNKEKLREVFPDGIVWYIRPESFAMVTEDGDLAGVGDRFAQQLRVCTMPALIFAIVTGDYRTASALFASEEYGAKEKMVPAREYFFERGPERHPFLLFENEDEMSEVPTIRMIYGHTYPNLYGFVLNDLRKKGKHLSRQFAYRFLKKYYDGEERGWMKADYGLLFHDWSEERDGRTFFPHEEGEDTPLMTLMKLLDHVRSVDEAFYRDLMYPELFNRLFIGCNMLIMEDVISEHLKLLKKLQYPELISDRQMWEIAADMSMHGWNEFNLPSYYWGSDISRNWKFVTGHQPVLDMSSVCFDVLVRADDEDDPSEDYPPFGDPFDCEDVLRVDMTAEGKISGNLLEFLIRNAKRAEYSNCMSNYAFDLEFLLDHCGEEVTLMAIRKDFIRQQDAEDMIRLSEEKNKTGLIPALLLKKHGEWH